MSNTESDPRNDRKNVSFKVGEAVEYAIDELQIFGKRIGLAQEGESKRSYRRMVKGSMVSAVILWLYDQPAAIRQAVLSRGIEILNALPKDAKQPPAPASGKVETVIIQESPTTPRKKPGDGKEKTG